jgi:hypothetical protein
VEIPVGHGCLSSQLSNKYDTVHELKNATLKTLNNRKLVLICHRDHRQCEVGESRVEMKVERRGRRKISEILPIPVELKLCFGAPCIRDSFGFGVLKACINLVNWMRSQIRSNRAAITKDLVKSPENIPVGPQPLKSR